MALGLIGTGIGLTIFLFLRRLIEHRMILFGFYAGLYTIGNGLFTIILFKMIVKKFENKLIQMG